MKQTLTLSPVDGGPFNCRPACHVELEAERILTNEVVLPWETRGDHGVRLFVIGNEYGTLGAVWARHEQDAFDQLVDSGLAAGLAIEEEDADEETARLGNAGEPHDLTYAWIQPVNLSPSVKGNVELLCKFAEARGANVDNLDQI